MITVWILTAQLAGGFTIAPFTDEAACLAALAGLASITSEADCTAIEMLEPASEFAPIMAPMPPRKGERA